ncbi:TetR/AcrR family transcriptional regulator [Sphaerisporangium viridialbum]|uniref:TetR/AcrR family transcriptional regulator n=1 Tax=Sphaerisporangium TaxID=321315 RepID=UPI003870560A
MARSRVTTSDDRPAKASAAKDEPVRQRLMAEATRLFADKGFESTSVQEIVAAAGVTKGAMYHYFDSKDDLLREIYARVLRMQIERLDRFAGAPGPVADRVHAAAVDVIATTVENLDDSKIFFRSMHQLTPETQKAVRAERRRYHERFRDLLVEGQRSKVFRDDVPADLVVDFFFGSVHHLGTWYHTDGRLSGTAVGEHFADLLLASLRP